MILLLNAIPTIPMTTISGAERDFQKSVRVFQRDVSFTCSCTPPGGDVFVCAAPTLLSGF